MYTGIHGEYPLFMESTRYSCHILTHWHTTFYNTWRTYIYIYIYICDISSLRVNGPSEPGRLRDVCVCQWVKET